MSSIAELLSQAESAVRAAEDLAGLDAVRVQFLGKKGVFTAQLRELGKLPPAEIPAAGKAINDAKSTLTAAIDARRAALESQRLERELAADALDVTLPGRGVTLVMMANSTGLVKSFPLAKGDVTTSPFARIFLSLFTR